MLGGRGGLLIARATHEEPPGLFSTGQGDREQSARWRAVTGRPRGDVDDALLAWLQWLIQRGGVVDDLIGVGQESTLGGIVASGSHEIAEQIDRDVRRPGIRGQGDGAIGGDGQDRHELTLAVDHHVRQLAIGCRAQGCRRVGRQCRDAHGHSPDSSPGSVLASGDVNNDGSASTAA